jgi:hypothetical protein
MSAETFSVILWCWHDLRTDALQVRVTRVDTGEEVHLDDGSFLLRISMDANASVLRCLVRHTTSRREAYVQSGLGLREFIKDCLLEGTGSFAACTPPTGAQEEQSESMSGASSIPPEDATDEPST